MFPLALQMLYGYSRRTQPRRIATDWCRYRASLYCTLSNLYRSTPCLQCYLPRLWYCWPAFIQEHCERPAYEAFGEPDIFEEVVYVKDYMSISRAPMR